MYIENEKNTVLCVKNANKRNVETAFFSLNCITAWKKYAVLTFSKQDTCKKYLFACMIWFSLKVWDLEDPFPPLEIFQILTKN